MRKNVKNSFKPKNSEIKHCALCLRNISQDFTDNNKKNSIKRSWKAFFC